jgi:CheY-like chemotaxis protein
MNLSAPIPDPIRKKRILLLDTSQPKRELRAEAMRKLGIDVDCAADITEARSWWKAAFYDLVLIDMADKLGYRDKFCDDLRRAVPPQRVAFLTGLPDYVADSPKADEEVAVDKAIHSTFGSLDVASSADDGERNQRWGILEASRRISAVRSASVARTQAMRALPAPPRDSEGRPSKAPATSTSLDDLLRKELQ